MRIVRETMEKPYGNEDGEYEDLTVGNLIEALKKLPEDYQISYDSFSCVPCKGALTIDHDSRMVCIND